MLEKIDELKRKRFARLASKRTNLVLHRLKVLSNCANPLYYQFFEFDIDKIFEEIRRKTDKAEFLFRSQVNRINKEDFKL